MCGQSQRTDHVPLTFPHGLMWREVVELSRPKNILIASMTVPLGAHLALDGNWSSNFILLVALQTTCVMFFMAAGNIFNDISDVDIDRIAKPHRPLPSNAITIKQATKIAYVFSLLSFILMLINPTSHQIMIWVIAGFLMYTYDMGPQTKKHGLIGNVAISLMVGAVVLYGAAAVGSLMTPMALYAAGVAFFANLGREIIKDCEDMESDEGRRTFPMKVGLMNARATAYVFILLAIVVLYLPHWLGPLTMNQLLFQAPAIFLLMSLNGPLFKGEDYIAQQRVRMGMLLGLLALVIEVSV